MGGKVIKVVARLANIQAGTKYQQEVCALQAEVAWPGANCSWPSCKQAVVRGDQVVRPGRGHRHPDSLHQAEQAVPCPCEPDAGAAQDQWAMATQQPIDNDRHLCSEGWPNGVPKRFVFARRLVVFVPIDFSRLNVQRNIQPRGAWATFLCSFQGQCQAIHGVACLVHQFGELADGSGHRDGWPLLVAQLAQLVKALSVLAG